MKKTLVSAISRRNLEEVGQYFDQHPKSINKFFKYNHGEWSGRCTPVFCAVARGDILTAKLLIQRGADVNIPAYIRTDEHQEKITCFVFACRYSYVELLKVLVDAGANVESPAEGEQQREAEGGLMSYAEGQQQTTCLHWAALTLKHHLVRELLNLGANPNLKSATGQTCLHYVCEVFCPPLIREVVHAGGVSSHPDMFNITPLMNLVSFPISWMDDTVHVAEAWKLVMMMLAAGYELNYEVWLISGRMALNAGRINEALGRDEDDLMNAPHSEVVRNNVRKIFGKDSLMWLFNWPHKPKSLKFICRLAVRRTIGSRSLRAKISQLELPQVLLKYLDLAIV